MDLGLLEYESMENYLGASPLPAQRGPRIRTGGAASAACARGGSRVGIGTAGATHATILVVIIDVEVDVHGAVVVVEQHVVLLDHRCLRSTARVDVCQRQKPRPRQPASPSTAHRRLGWDPRFYYALHA